ncbi:MAG: OmpA family protein, partial [Phycicoccus sp.]
YGTVRVYPYQQAERPAVTVAVHAVQRVPGATVVYLSLETDPGGPPPRPLASGDGLTGVRLVDRRAGVVLSTVEDPDAGRLRRPFASPAGALPTTPGVMGVLYTVLPELPAGTTRVDVQPMLGTVIPDVPVADGVLAPALDEARPIPLGTGWPAVRLAAVRRIDAPERSVHELTSVVEEVSGASTTRRTPSRVSVDVAADVLFAVDSSVLTPRSRATLGRVVDQVAREAVGSRLEVVGHTDSDANDAYNDALSRRRARAVAGVLQPAARQAGLSVVATGRGEWEPVASNATAAGKQANRRVTVTFEIAGAGGGSRRDDRTVPCSPTRRVGGLRARRTTGRHPPTGRSVAWRCRPWPGPLPRRIVQRAGRSFPGAALAAALRGRPRG